MDRRLIFTTCDNRTNLFYQEISSSKLCRRMNICIQVTEEANTEKESKEVGESVRGCCNSFDNGNREH